MPHVNLNNMIKAMGAVLQPQLPELANTAMDVYKKEMKAFTKDPLLLLATDITVAWVRKKGLAEGVVLAGKLHEALSGDGTDIASLDGLTAKQLTKLADVYQNAEANSKVMTRRSLHRLGNILGDFGRYAGRAFLVSLVA